MVVTKITVGFAQTFVIIPYKAVHNFQFHFDFKLALCSYSYIMKERDLVSIREREWMLQRYESIYNLQSNCLNFFFYISALEGSTMTGKNTLTMYMGDWK